jgi:NitT/TauT family transport system substrate-binding protein
MMKGILNGGPVIDRRRLLTATAAGVAITTLGPVGRAFAADTVRWVSPRGTLEVVDDWAYWVAKKYGYFGDIETTIEPGPMEATAVVKLVDQKQSDFGYPSPGIFSLGLEQGMDLASAFHIMAGDVFDFAFQKGKAPADFKGLEGKTIVLGSAGWQAITNPMLSAAGVDPASVKYVEAGGSWGQTLAQGQADAALSWEGLRAQWRGQGLDFDYLLGKNVSTFPANSYVTRKSDLSDPAKKELYTKYLRGFAMGYEFGHINPRAASHIVMEQFPGLKTQMSPAVITESMMQMDALAHAKWEERQSMWGYHLMPSWQAYFDTIKKIGQITKDIKAEDVVSNELIPGANDFDKAKVKADADGYELPEEWKAIDVEAIRAAI